jgi:hypothetical protein
MKRQRNHLALAVCFIATFLLCAPAKGQIQTIGDSSTDTSDATLKSTYSSSGAAPLPSGMNAELETRVMRDTNVFSSNARPFSDFIYEEGAVINLWKSQPRWNFAFQYRPTGVLYQKQSELNAFDQGLSLVGGYSFTPRLRFTGTETFEARTGELMPSSNQYFVLPTSTVPGLNTTLIAPTSRDISNGSQGEIEYDVSPRTTLDFSGGYLLQDFSGVNTLPEGVLPATLLDTNGATGAAEYRYRVSERFTVGLRYLYQYFHYGTGGSDQTNSGFLTAHWDVKQYASLDLYGGPSDSSALGTSSLEPVANQTSGTFQTLSPAFGGTFSLRSDDTVFNVSAQHLVSSGGGLLMTVTSDYEGAELRHQLGDNWDVVVSGGYARVVALQSQTSKGKADTQTFATAFERPLLEKLSVHFEWDYLRQRVNQFVPLGSNVNENEFSVSLFYRMGAPRL